MNASCSPSASVSLPAGMRATRATQALLALLPQQPAGGWSHAALEAALHQQGHSINRVTIYRVLDRLCTSGVLRKHVDAQRTTRFELASADTTAPANTSAVACTDCSQPLVLGEAAAQVQSALQALQQALAHSTGTPQLQLAVGVQGACQHCGPPSPTR